MRIFNMLPDRWVILWNNQPVGLDSGSGGYSYKTDEPSSVKYWRRKEEAQEYWNVMNYRSGLSYDNYKIVRIQFQIFDE